MHRNLNLLATFALAAAVAVVAGCGGEDADDPGLPGPNTPTTPSVRAQTPDVPAADLATRPAVAQAPLTLPPGTFGVRRLGEDAPLAADPEGPLPAAMHVDGRPVQFAPAVLHLTAGDGGTKAVLYSDDPDDAMRPGWSGNSFYFEMFFDGKDVAQVLGESGLADWQGAGGPAVAEWVFRFPESERRDTDNGLFLAGDTIRLQPADGAVQIDPAGARLNVRVEGLFRRFEGQTDRIGREVPVRAVLYPTVVER